MKTQISIAMSTFNGESYIQQQIESILNQENVDTVIHIRDDGSSDGTVQKIEALIELYPGRITLDHGNNIGYEKSFLKALADCPDASYYAFADQDDIWQPLKCYRAIQALNGSNEIALYASSLILVDENEAIIGENNIANMTNSIECYFARSRLAGCTFVFTKKLREISVNQSDAVYTIFPSHDFIVGACAYAFGEVYLDESSYILHRRLSISVTGGGNGFWKRLKVEKKVIFDQNKVYRDVARNILLCSGIKKESQEFLRCLSDYDTSFRNKVRLIRRKGYRSGFWICDMEMIFKVLIGKM